MKGKKIRYITTDTGTYCLMPNKYRNCKDVLQYKQRPIPFSIKHSKQDLGSEETKGPK